MNEDATSPASAGSLTTSGLISDWVRRARDGSSITWKGLTSSESDPDYKPTMLPD